jgi:glycosyltransferase involved in cell wall biosynthesis
LASLFIKRATAAPVSAQRVGVVGSYPPTVSGSAIFANSLRAALMHDRPGVDIGIVRVRPQEDAHSNVEVVCELSTSDDEYRCKAAAGELNKYDVAVIQYGPGSFGGAHSEQVLFILKWIRVPVVVVVHDVPADSAAPDAAVLRSLGESADALVTMSETARQRLVAFFGVPPRKVMVIQHGAHVAPLTTGIRIDRGRRPCVLTWGLLAPGKGIEWAIEAMAPLAGMRPRPRYVVAGPTHPQELAMDGDRYRNAMAIRADKLDLASVVEFALGYLSQAHLEDLIHEADVVLIPYDSADVCASAVLVQAIGARKPVVATRFSHAVELLDGDHGGLLVAPREPQQIAAALTRILTESGLADKLVLNAAGLADSLSWPTVAAQYRQLFDALLRKPGAR